MPRNGTGTVRTRRDRPVEHGKPGQVPVCGMASLGRMESTGGLRRAAPLACARQGRARPADRDRGRGDDAETARRPNRGGVREGVTKRGRVHPTRPPRGFSIDPRLCKGVAKGSFDSPDQVVGYRITWRSRDGWTERFNATDLGADMRLKELRNGWTHDARSESLAVQECTRAWRTARRSSPTPGTAACESLHA